MAATRAGRPPVAAALTGSAPAARFDDLAAGRAAALHGFRAALVARSPDEVPGVIDAAEAAAAAGDWVAGVVAYEAAAGLDGALDVGVPPGAGDGAPLAWFGCFAGCREVHPVTPPGPAPVPAWRLDTPAELHAAQVARIRDHIEAGDVYQCNLTARYRCDDPGDPGTLYRRLALAQRSAHCALVDTGSVVVASASPELFFERRGDDVVTRPMKGTAARGRWSEEDRAVGAALAASAKDRAENVMIVDLLRNDLGRLAVYGTVAVPALWSLERYRTLWQLTSTVTARVRPGTTLLDLFRALFPSGSVTGAPKRRAMEVIAGVEGSPRGVYCGAVGLLSPGPRPQARFNVAIRTAVVDRHTGRAVYGSGGGIVWDSEANDEFRELAAKAAVLAADPAEVTLLETMRCGPDGVVGRWAGHRARLADSARYFGVALDDAAVDRALKEALAGGPPVDRLVRLTVSDAAGPAVEVRPLAPDAGGPVTLAVDEEPVDPARPQWFHKVTDRSPYTTRAARHPGADQVVLVNRRGEVTETSVATLAVHLEGRWCTPPLDAGCLPGVARAALLADGTLVERAITVAELRQADAVAVVSSARGWREAVLVPGPPTA